MKQENPEKLAKSREFLAQLKEARGGSYADSQVSRRFLEIEYGLVRTRFHIFHSLLLCLAILSHIIGA